MVPLTVAIALGASLLGALGSYFGQLATVNQRIAEVREEYVKKEELREQVKAPLDQLQQRVEDLRREQAVQGQVLKDIRELLERRTRGAAGGRP